MPHIEDKLMKHSVLLGTILYVLLGGCGAEEKGSCVDLTSGNCVDDILRTDCDGTFAEGKACEDIDTNSGVVVDDNGTTISHGEESGDPMPSETTTGEEAQVLQSDGAAWISEGSSHILEVIFDSVYPITDVHLEIGGKHFIAPAFVPTFSLPECQELLEPQGVTCTEECNEACGCISCDTTTEEEQLFLACAVNCSAYAANGLFGDDQPYRNEAHLADTIYNGVPDLGIEGTAPDTCTAQLCSDNASESAQKAVRVEFFNNNLDHIKNLDVNAMIVDSNPPGEPRGSLRSESASQSYGLSMPGDCEAGRGPCIQ